jgi:hypothetical protein
MKIAKKTTGKKSPSSKATTWLVDGYSVRCEHPAVIESVKTGNTDMLNKLWEVCILTPTSKPNNYRVTTGSVLIGWADEATDALDIEGLISIGASA